MLFQVFSILVCHLFSPSVKYEEMSCSSRIKAIKGERIILNEVSVDVN